MACHLADVSSIREIRNKGPAMQLRFTPVHVLLASTMGPFVAAVVFTSAPPAGAQMVVAGPRAGIVGPTTIMVPGVGLGFGSGISIHAPLVTVHIPPPGAARQPYTLPRRRFLSRWRQLDSILPLEYPNTRNRPNAATRRRATEQESTRAPWDGETGRIGGTGSALPNGTPTLATSTMVASPERSIGDNLPSTSNTFPSDEALAAMNDGNFLNALAVVWHQLDSRLTRFSTGAGWQRYLGMPAGVLPSGGNVQCRSMDKR